MKIDVSDVVETIAKIRRVCYFTFSHAGVTRERSLLNDAERWMMKQAPLDLALSSLSTNKYPIRCMYVRLKLITIVIQKIYSSSLPLSSSSLLLSSDGGSSLNSTSSTGSSCSISLSRDALITWELSDDKLIKTASSVRMVRLPWYGQVLSLRNTISIG